MLSSYSQNFIYFFKKKVVKNFIRLKCVTENHFSYFSTKTYVVGTQKNLLNEKVLLSTHNICL